VLGQKTAHTTWSLFVAGCRCVGANGQRTAHTKLSEAEACSQKVLAGLNYRATPTPHLAVAPRVG